MTRPDGRPSARPWRGPHLLLVAACIIMAGSVAGPALGVASEPGATPPTIGPAARLSGEGSSWLANAVDDWQIAVKSQGVTVDYTPNGSSQGRKDFALGLADFAVSEIPYRGATSDPQDVNFPDFGYRLLPAAAGGTSFMYNLPVNGHDYRDLKLSQAALAKIFTGQVTQWDDPAIRATNPGVALPSHQITVVVRTDGAGVTAQLTSWLKKRFPDDYRALCAATGCDPAAATSYFPYSGLDNFSAQSGSNGTTTYTANTQYAINYDEYSYALGVDFPVAKVQNAAGYFTEPTDSAVSVALTQAKINNDPASDDYLTQDLSGAYSYRDPRTYPLSSFSYLIQPTETHDHFTEAKGETLAYFEQFALCEGQQVMRPLGYAPLPMNLVLAALDQVLLVPGISPATEQSILDTKNGVKHGGDNPCRNPTFRPGDSPSHNVLVETAPFPPGCDAACQAPWIGKSPATITTRLRPRHPQVGVAPHLTVDVTTDGANAVGSVRVKVDPPKGRTRTLSGTLRRGEAVFAIPKAIRGRTHVTVTYPGNDTVAKAVKTLTYRVHPTRMIGEQP